MAFSKKNWEKEVSCKMCGEKRLVRKDTYPEFCKKCAAKNTGEKLKGKTWAKTKKCFGCENKIKDNLRYDYCSVNCRTKHKQIQMVCKKCSCVFTIRKSAVSGKTNASGNFCSRECYNKFLCRTERITGRGSQWNKTRKSVISKFPFCAVCGTTKNLQVHHIIPFRLTKDNREENLIPLCRKHHKEIEMMFLNTEFIPVDINFLFWNNVLRTRQQTTKYVLKELYAKNRKLAFR